MKWQGRISWLVSIAMFVAIVAFGAPLITFLFVIVGLLTFFALGESWYERRRHPHR